VAARGVRRLEKNISRIFTSPLTRATQTATIVADELGSQHEVEILDSLAPGASQISLIRRLNECGRGETILLVGHEPDLGSVAGTFLFGREGVLPLKKAGACAIAFDGPVKTGAGQLQWFVPPPVLARISRKRKRT
jgi:phosphohistidine phosphatase